MPGTSAASIPLPRCGSSSRLRVTLEDVVAVTSDGYEILSAGLPTTIAEVEAIVGAEARE